MSAIVKVEEEGSGRNPVVPDPSKIDQKALDDLRRECDIPDGVELAVLTPAEYPANVEPGFCCAYATYFQDYELFFPISRFVLEVLADLRLAFPHMSLNLVRAINGCVVRAREENVIFRYSDLRAFFSVKYNAQHPRTFYASPRSNRQFIEESLEKDSGWEKTGFKFRVNEVSIRAFNFARLPTELRAAVV